MPAATDVENAIADRVWVLFEAQATITSALLVGNRNKGDKVGWLYEMVGKDPVGERRLSVAFGRFEHSLHSKRSGFAIEDDEWDTDDNDDFDVVQRHELIITYKEPLPTDPGANPVKAAIEQTLFLAMKEPYMGLSSLKARMETITGETRPTRRDEFPKVGRITTIRVFIITTQSARTLVTQTV